MLLTFGPKTKGCDIAQVDTFALNSAHFNIAKAFNLIRFGIKGQGEFARAIIDLTNWDLGILAPNRLHHLHHCQPTCREFVAIHIHHDLAFHAANQLNTRDTWQRGVLVGQGIVRIIVEIVYRKRTLQHQGHYGRGIDVKLQDFGFLCGGGQVVHNEVDLLTHIRCGHVHITIEIKLNQHLCKVIQAGGGHMFDTFHLRNCVFNLTRDRRFEFVRRSTCVDHGDGHIGHLNRWQEVVAQPFERQKTEEGEHDNQHAHRNRSFGRGRS